MSHRITSNFGLTPFLICRLWKRMRFTNPSNQQRISTRSMESSQWRRQWEPLHQQGEMQLCLFERNGRDLFLNFKLFGVFESLIGELSIIRVRKLQKSFLSNSFLRQHFFSHKATYYCLH